MIPFHAGGDWSGNPNRRDEPFLFCVVALPDGEALNEPCLQLRDKLGMARSKEFHGHEMKGDQQRFELLRVGQTLGMRCGALVISSPRQSSGYLSYEDIALELLRNFLPMCALRSLWCDTEIEGEQAKTFETAVKRCNRVIYPGERLKVRVRDSKTIHLIQLADVMAYALRTQVRNTLESPELRQFLKEMEAGENNLILYR